METIFLMIANDHTSLRRRLAGGISSWSLSATAAADIVSLGWELDLPINSGTTLDFDIFD